MPTLPDTNPTRDNYFIDRSNARIGPSINPNTKRPPQPYDVGDEGGPPMRSSVDQQNRRIGLEHELTDSAGKYGEASFGDHWKGVTQGIDSANNDAVDTLGKKYGVVRGRVGMTATGNHGTVNDWHTMSNDEYLTAIKSKARNAFLGSLNAGYASQMKSPADLLPGPIGPTPTGTAQGAVSPAAPDGPTSDVLAGFQQRKAGLALDQAPMIARRTGMQPYDVINEQEYAKADHKPKEDPRVTVAKLNNEGRTSAAETTANARLQGIQETNDAKGKQVESTNKTKLNVAQLAANSKWDLGKMTAEELRDKLDETIRHNKATEGVAQQNADTNADKGKMTPEDIARNKSQSQQALIRYAGQRGIEVDKIPPEVTAEIRKGYGLSPDGLSELDASGPATQPAAGGAKPPVNPPTQTTTSAPPPGGPGSGGGAMPPGTVGATSTTPTQTPANGAQYKDPEEQWRNWFARSKQYPEAMGPVGFQKYLKEHNGQEPPLGTNAVPTAGQAAATSTSPLLPGQPPLPAAWQDGLNKKAATEAAGAMPSISTAGTVIRQKSTGKTFVSDGANWVQQ